MLQRRGISDAPPLPPAKAGEFLKLPKLGTLKVRWSQVPTGIPKMATVSKMPDGRYFVAFSCEVEIQPLLATGKAVGLDLGVKDVVVDSDGWKSGNPRHLKGRLRHLKRHQRRLARIPSARVNLGDSNDPTLLPRNPDSDS